jgi:hypothetical protein
MGAYSDKDPSWTPALKRELGWTDADDGTFWMYVPTPWPLPRPLKLIAAENHVCVPCTPCTPCTPTCP